MRAADRWTGNRRDAALREESAWLFHHRFTDWHLYVDNAQQQITILILSTLIKPRSWKAKANSRYLAVNDIIYRNI